LDNGKIISSLVLQPIIPVKPLTSSLTPEISISELETRLGTRDYGSSYEQWVYRLTCMMLWWLIDYSSKAMGEEGSNFQLNQW